MVTKDGKTVFVTKEFQIVEVAPDTNKGYGYEENIDVADVDLYVECL